MTRSTGAVAAATAFLLTGVGTALLGATLPASLHVWHLSDAGGGKLLFASWGGSTLGAFAAGQPRRWFPSAGLLITAGALFSFSRPHPAALFLAFLAFGFGMGVTMTAISTLQSRSVAEVRAEVEMNRLNLLWAAGACFAPFLALRSLHRLNDSSLFLALSVLFSCVSGAVLFLYWPRAAAGKAVRLRFPTATPSAAVLPLVPAEFCLYSAASVGLESAIGAWLTTYAGRLSTGVTIAVSANAAFWCGLLLSRAAHSLPQQHFVHQQQVRRVHTALTGVALGLLIAAPGRLLTPVAALLCGFGLGPLYPWVLSRVLPRFRSTLVFAAAGVGSAVLPWMTGALSTQLHSLRLGLLAPAAVYLLLLLSASRIRSDSPTPGPVR